MTFDRIQDVSSGVLLGRFAGGSGAIQEITVGSGLSLSPSGELSATAVGGGGITGVTGDQFITVNTATPDVPALGLDTNELETHLSASFARADDSRIENAVQRTGDTMTGALNLPLNGLSVGGMQLVAKDGRIGIGTNSPSVLLDVAGVVKIAGTGSESCAPGDAGTIRYKSGDLEFCNGSDWQTLGVSGAGLTSLNGQTGSAQSLQVQVGGVTAPAFASASNTHTLRLPMASDVDVTAGLISKAEYDNFNSKLSSNLGAGEIFVGNASNQAAAVQPSGDVSMNSSGAFTVTGLRGRAVSNTAPADGQVLKYVGGGTNAWVPSNFSVGDLKTAGGVQQFANATCSASQTLTWSSLTDTFTCTNIGGLDASAITSGQFNIARIPTGTTAGTVAVGNDSRFPSSACGAGNKMRWDGSSWQCEPDNATDSTKVSKSGDTMTGVLNLPSNGLVVGTDQLVATGGKVGIGVTSPSAKLDVAGEIKVGNTNSTCDSSTEGHQRYNDTSKKMEYCNGSQWVEFGSGGAGGGGSLYGYLKMESANNCYWSSTSSSFVTVNTNDNDCPTPTVSGNASLPAEGKIPAIRFANLPAGNYEVRFNAQMVDFLSGSI